MSIGPHAFYGCSSLKTVNLPNLKTIGNDAFFKCTSLTSIDISNVESVADYAFSGCSNLKTVDTRSATDIEMQGFMACINLQHIAVKNLDVELGKVAFSGVCQDSFHNPQKYGTLTVYYEGCSGTEAHAAKTTEENDFVTKLQTAGLNSQVTVQFAPLGKFPGAQPEEPSAEQPPAPDNALARTILNLF